jgi:hypothetical protein
MYKVGFSVVVVGFLSGCGGSGSSDTLGSSIDTIDSNIAAVSGVYDSSRSADESYLYIARHQAL